MNNYTLFKGIGYRVIKRFKGIYIITDHKNIEHFVKKRRLNER